ncbi:MAG: SPFH domain-containing protein [Bacteroidales bacterium]|nr:MAG: SPFH domain-containing protein [Bacteroidales bacterium]
MEKEFQPKSGYLMFLVFILSLGAVLTATIVTENPLFVIGFIVIPLIAPGFIVINPNESAVLVLFGKYVGTIRINGFFWTNPFYIKKRISLRARNFNGEPIKVNDKVGNPIMIGLVLVWKVNNTFKASFDVDQYEHFVVVQSDAALRKLAGMFPYDNFEHETDEITLRSGGEQVNQKLELELIERLSMAGIEVIEARINYIAYASEIAGAMLRRQQATAVVAARSKIVEGAVGMVQMALDQLADKQIVELDEEKKAAMVSNLMVVLCSEESARPIINAGTLHQ